MKKCLKQAKEFILFKKENGYNKNGKNEFYSANVCGCTREDDEYVVDLCVYQKM